MRLAHFIKNGCRAMLGRNLKLTADMVLHKLSEKGIVLIPEQIIIPYARTDKDLFNIRQLPHTAQNIEIFAVVNIQIFAGLRRKAFFALAFWKDFAILSLLGYDSSFGRT